MMAEVLRRRFVPGDGKAVFPDLLLIDGGKGHLNIALDILHQRNLENEVELASIAKDRENRSDKIYRPGRKNHLSLSRHSPVLFFLMQIRDESHRFGITLHRRLRRRDALASELDKVPGVGTSRRKTLLQHLGSLAKIRKSTLEELAAVPGIGPELAGQIRQYFHRDRKGEE